MARKPLPRAMRHGKLTSERVTSWTLSDRLHRVDVSVPIAYAADPARVLSILRDTARTYTKALVKPAPEALCTGFREIMVFRNDALAFEVLVHRQELATRRRAHRPRQDEPPPLARGAVLAEDVGNR